MVWITRRKYRKSALSVVVAVSAAALMLTGCNSAATDVSPIVAPSEVPVDPNAVPASMVGLHIEGVEGGAWASAPFGALRLWDNGTAWSQIELAKGEFKWDNIEGSLENAESKGLTDIMLVLGTTPDWAAKEINDADYPQPGAASAPKNLKDWDDWVTEVVTRYKGRFSSYQIWNEANLINFYNGTPEEMAEMTKRAYDIIKSIDPEALVIAPSPSLRLSKAFERFYPTYLAKLSEFGWPVDVFAIHTYPKADGDPVARGALVRVAQAALTAAGAPKLPLWDTELNYGLAGPGDLPREEITGAQAAGFVVRTYIDDLRLGIDRSYWYIWTLRPYDLLGVQAYAGSDGEQGFFAVDAWVTGATFDGCTETDNAVSCDFSRGAGSEKWVVAWAQTGEVAYTTPENSALVCDPLANCQEAAGGTTITLTEVPVRVYLQ
jgi:hypothetical protein